MDWALLVGPVSAIAGVVVGHLIGARRERDAARWEWSRSQLDASRMAVVDLLAASEHSPVDYTLPRSEQRSAEWSQQFARLEGAYAALRPLVLHPDEPIRDRALAAMDAVYPALVAVDFYERSGSDDDREKAAARFSELQVAASELAEVVRSAPH